MFSNYRTILFSLVLVMALMFSMQPSVRANDAEQNIMLKLTVNGTFFNAATVYISRLGIRTKERLGDVLITADEPFAYSLNSENHFYLQQDLPDYIRDTRNSVPVIGKELERWNDQRQKFFGFDLQRCFYYSRQNNKEVMIEEFEAIKNPPVPQKVQKLWCKIFGITSERSMLPVKCRQATKKSWLLSQAEQVLETAKENQLPKTAEVLTCSKIEKLPLQSSLFRLPQHWSKAKDKAEWALSAAGQFSDKDLDDLFRSAKPRK